MLERASKRHKKLLSFVLPLLIVISSVLAGCSPLTVAEQASAFPDPFILSPGDAVGQTFVATYDGLRGVTMSYSAPQPVTLSCHLRLSPDDTVDLRSVTTSLGTANELRDILISFEPVNNSAYTYYYWYCETPVDAPALNFKMGAGRTYLQGALYENHSPRDAQLTFQLHYDRWLAISTLFANLAGSMGLLALALLAFLLPGWALIVYVWPDSSRSLPEHVGLSVGLSLAVYPVLFLFSHMIGLHLGWLYAWLPAAVAVTALMLYYKLWSQPSRIKLWRCMTEWYHSEHGIIDVTWFAVLLVIFSVRFIVVRNLEAPMWGDSYQHTMITQLLIDNHGLFDSWAPYATLTSFTYHFGFHADMAVLHWVTGLNASDSVLWGGQLLNGLAIVTLSPLAARLTKRRWTVVYTMIIAGAFTAMPMYYTNWGRYTQLAGQAILPVALVAGLELLSNRKRQPSLIWLGWLSIGGLALTHLRVLVFFIAFVIAWFVSDLKCPALRDAVLVLKQRISRVAWLAVGGVLILAPWVLHGLGGGIQQNFTRHMTMPANTSSYLSSYNAVGALTTYMTPVLWLMFFAGAAVALWQKKESLRLLVIWCFLLLLMTNPAWLRLPGTGVISNFALYIAVYIPASILIAYLIDQCLRKAQDNHLLHVGLALIAVLATLYGAYLRRQDIKPEGHLLVTRPDVRAAAWIQDNLPQTTRFWTNGFLAYANSLVVGSDGGWWLPLLANRDSILPPLNYGTESSEPPDLKARLKQLTLDFQQYGPADAGVVDSLHKFGITHVYIGQRHGSVNYTGPFVLHPADLVSSPDYTLVYHEDRVWIFALESLEK